MVYYLYYEVKCLSGGGLLARLKNDIRHRCAECAKKTFVSNGNQLKLAFCILLCVAVTMLAWFLSDLFELAFAIFAVSYNEPAVYWYSILLLCLLIILLAAPVYIGMFGVAMRMSQGESAEIVDIFDTFSSPKAYGRALRISLNLFVRILPIVLLLRFPYLLDTLAYYFTVPELVYEYVWFAVIPIALVVVLPVGSSFGFVSFSYLYENESLRACVRQARKARKGNYKAIYSLVYTTLIKLLLSLLTVGVWTVIHTIPMALLDYASLATELDNNN